MLRRLLGLFVLSTAAGLSISGIRIAGRSPPRWVTDEFTVACWLRNEFNDACSTFRGDVRRRCMAIWFETTGQHNDDWHDEWHRRGQRASFEALAFCRTERPPCDVSCSTSGMPARNACIS